MKMNGSTTGKVDAPPGGIRPPHEANLACGGSPLVGGMAIRIKFLSDFTQIRRVNTSETIGGKGLRYHSFPCSGVGACRQACQIRRLVARSARQPMR